MKRFKYILPQKFKVAVWIVLAVWSVIIFFTLSRLFNLFGLKPSVLWLEYTTLILSVLLVVFMIACLNVNYCINSKNIKLSILFFDIFCGKIKTQDIKQIVRDTKNNKLYILSQKSAEQPIITNINIAAFYFNDFSDTLKNINKDIIYTESD